MTTYYNEIDPKAASWLRELAKRNHISAGEIDERSISDVNPTDLTGYRQVHLFAGIGGWSYALRLAGIPDNFPVWTGSCPCQPFSNAGKKKGKQDERHLWPEMRRLVEQCLPPVVFGEQVASKLGRAWLAAVRADLESLGYAVGAADLCAAGVGAPHIRQRLYWGAVRLADAHCERFEGRQVFFCERESSEEDVEVARSGGPLRVADSHGEGPQGRGFGRSCARERTAWTYGLERQGGNKNRRQWGNPDWLFCRDSKWRPVEPGTFPLAHGISARVGRLRGYGNAIVPQVAAAFITSFLEAVSRA